MLKINDIKNLLNIYVQLQLDEHPDFFYLPLSSESDFEVFRKWYVFKKACNLLIKQDINFSPEFNYNNLEEITKELVAEINQNLEDKFIIEEVRSQNDTLTQHVKDLNAVTYIKESAY